MRETKEQKVKIKKKNDQEPLCVRSVLLGYFYQGYLTYIALILLEHTYTHTSSKEHSYTS